MLVLFTDTGQTNARTDGQTDVFFNWFFRYQGATKQGFWLHHVLRDFFNLIVSFIHFFVITARHEFFSAENSPIFAQHYITFPILRISLRVYVRTGESKNCDSIERTFSYYLILISLVWPSFPVLPHLFLAAIIAAILWRQGFPQRTQTRALIYTVVFIKQICTLKYLLFTQ